jgi:hypothetical protein
MAFRTNTPSSASVFVSLPSSYGRCGTCDECSNQHRKEGEECQRRSRLSGRVCRLADLCLDRLFLRDHVVNAFLCVGLRQPGSRGHKLRKTGLVGRWHLTVAQPRREDAASFSSDLAGRRVRVG